VDASGTLRSSGLNTRGQLGFSPAETILTYTTTPQLLASPVLATSSGPDHTAILYADGTLYTTGDNASGQLGDGTTTSRNTPVQIASGVSSILAAPYATFLIKKDGTLWATGDNSAGRLGLPGESASTSTPALIATNVRSVSCALRHTLIVKNDNTLWATGDNTAGRYGDTHLASSRTPVFVRSGVHQALTFSSPWFDLISELDGSLLLLEDGTLWLHENGEFARGLSYPNGQIYNPSSHPFFITRQAPLLIATEVLRATADYGTLLYLRRDRTLWVLGASTQGELGLGTTTAVTPALQALTGVLDVALGSHLGSATHTYILRADQSLWATGANSSGQLGDGTTTNRNTPARIADGVLSLSPGRFHSFFLQLPPPAILVPPASLAVRAGDSATFTVQASGHGPLAYQWQRNGAPISGATSPTYTLAPTQLTDAADYTVRVSESGVDALSPTANLLVHLETHTTYAAWAAANGITGAPTYSPGGGGPANLLRFAFNLSPQGPGLNPVTLEISDPSGTPRLAIRFRRKTYAPGLRYFVEASSTLIGDWQPVATIHPGLPADIEVLDTVPLAANTRRFLRVRLSYP
jgi:alpha-tubulin suppressor-like RCC1 family protein